MSRDPAIRALTVITLSGRVAYGVALLLAPARVAGNRWLGAGARTPAAEVALSGRDACPLLAASIAGDLSDIAATAAARDRLPDGSAPATAAVAGGSALLSAAAVAGLSR